MPSVLILDNNISLLRSSGYQSASLKNKLDLAIAGILTIIKYLEINHPNDEICIINTSASDSTPQFENTRSEGLEQRLRSIASADNTSIVKSLNSLSEVVAPRYKCETPLQVVLFTDTRPITEDLEAFAFQCVTRVHVVALSTPEDTSSFVSNQPNHHQSNHTAVGDSTDSVLKYSQFVKRHFGSFRLIRLPNDAVTYSETITDLCKRHFGVYSGTLECGHLTAPMRLFPDPNLSLFISGILEAEIPSSLPSTLSICGFLPLARIPAPQTLSRHLVCHTDANDTHLLFLLMEKLRSERMGAVVRLSNEYDWFGLLCSLSSASQTETRYGLTLNVLLPNLWIDGLGKLRDLIVLEGGGDQKQTDDMAWKSYLPPGKNIYAAPALDADALRADIQKITRFAKNLPSKKEQLYSECDAFRITAKTFHLPQLLKVLCEKLDAQIQEQKDNAETVKVLSELITQLSSQPTDLSAVIKVPSAAVTETKKPSLNSLLN